jgi:hypothetical protein
MDEEMLAYLYPESYSDEQQSSFMTIQDSSGNNPRFEDDDWPDDEN